MLIRSQILIRRKSVGAEGLWEGVNGFWKLVVVGDLCLLLLLLLQRKFLCLSLLHAFGRMVFVVVALIP